MKCCCDVFSAARAPCSDSEQYGRAIAKNTRGAYQIGSIEKFIDFCPWCGSDFPKQAREDSFKKGAEIGRLARGF